MRITKKPKPKICQKCHHQIKDEKPAYIDSLMVCQFCFGQIKNSRRFRNNYIRLGWI